MTATVGPIVLVRMDPGMNNGGDVAPPDISRVWDGGSVNVHVLPDGNVTEWRTSLVEVEDLDDRNNGSRHVWMWPPRA